MQEKELLHRETLDNGCIVEHTQEGESVRVTVWHPEGSLSSTALRSPEYIAHDPHYYTGIEEQVAGLLLHGTGA